jgi:hypothetical protein
MQICFEFILDTTNMNWFFWNLAYMLLWCDYGMKIGSMEHAAIVHLRNLLTILFLHKNIILTVEGWGDWEFTLTRGYLMCCWMTEQSIYWYSGVAMQINRSKQELARKSKHPQPFITGREIPHQDTCWVSENSINVSRMIWRIHFAILSGQLWSVGFIKKLQHFSGTCGSEYDICHRLWIFHLMSIQCGGAKINVTYIPFPPHHRPVSCKTPVNDEGQ